MKKLSFLLVIILMISACNQQTEKTTMDKMHSETTVSEDGFYGETFDADKAVSSAELVTMLEKENPVAANLRGKIVQSCTHMGCWMDIDLGEGQKVHVTFTDDSFTIPLDAAGMTAIFKGKGSKEEVSAELLKAYAKDEGKTQEEIDAITEPGWEYSFIASGVKLIED
jgi:hypothetical protein